MVSLVKLYSVVVNGNRYDATTNATNTIDSIGKFFANYISSTDPTVNGFYNSSSNILTLKSILPGNYNIAASTGVPSPTVAVVIPKDNPRNEYENISFWKHRRQTSKHFHAKLSDIY